MVDKKILITFDYELFLGTNSGSVQKCLIEPTNLILDVLRKYQLSSIFFVDTLYLYRLKGVAEKNIKAKNDFDAIIYQLREVIHSKGRVFHHLHPHWLDAVYDEKLNSWDVSNFEKFSLQNLSNEEVDKVFNISRDIINLIYLNDEIGIQGFRAGGLYAQPFSRYKKNMLQNNIKYDFSVLKDSISKGQENLYSFDYTNYPKSDVYSFSNEVNIEDKKGEFIEFSLSHFDLKGIRKIINGIYFRLNKYKIDCKRIGDGKASGNKLASKEKPSKFSTKETFSIELMNSYKNILYTSYVTKNDLFHLISHPKLISISNVKSFDNFIVKLKQRYLLISDLDDVILKK